MTKVGRGLSNTLKKVSGNEPIDYDQIDQTKKHGNYDPKINPNDLGDIGVDQTKNWPPRYDNTRHNTDWTNYDNKSLNPTGIKKQGAWDLDKLSNQTADSIGVDRQQFKRIRDYPEDYPRDNKFHSDSESRAERQKQYDAYFTIHGTKNIDSNRGYEDNPYVQDYKKRKEWENQPQRESTKQNNNEAATKMGGGTNFDKFMGRTGNDEVDDAIRRLDRDNSPSSSGSKRIKKRGYYDIDGKDYYYEGVSSVGNKLSIVEGGAMPGVGAIHISEIEPTLAKLEKALGLDLMSNTLGSVGKRQFSGDIDVALKIERDEIPEFLAKLKSTPDIKDIAQSSVIMTKVQIQNYDGTKTDGRPRTGFVQVDFMPGDPGWLKTYYHSPHENDSKYKGVFRNLLLASICGIYDRQDSAEQIEDGRPKESLRYMWSPTDGLIRVKRTPVLRKDGKGYTAKNANAIMAGPFKQADEIAQNIGLDNGADLDSFESLLAAIKKKYPQDIVNKITDAFLRNNTVKDIGIPSELA